MRALKNASFAFYQFPTRAWELILGALAAVFLSIRDGRSFGSRISNAMSLLGLGSYLYLNCLVIRNQDIPGVTLPAHFRDIVIDCFLPAPAWVAKLLGHKWLVAIGLVSYSVYLWHQPIFAFSKHYLVAPASWQLIAYLGVRVFRSGILHMAFRRDTVQISVESNSSSLHTAFFRAFVFLGFGLLGHFSTALMAVVLMVSVFETSALCCNPIMDCPKNAIAIFCI